mgnify:CR=1 FL=1
MEWKGAGPGVLLVHAGVADSRMWDPQFEPLAAAHHVIRFDIRGFGRSPMPPGTFAYHDDIAAVARAAGCDRVTLIGCSFGGHLCLDTALAYPDLAERLVLVAPSLGTAAEDEAMGSFGGEEEALLERGDLDGATELNLRMWVDGPHRAPEQVDPAVREKVRVMQREAFAMEMPEGVKRTRLDPPAAEQLGAIRVPTLAVVGALDVPVLLDVAERIEREVPGARRVVIPNAAHMVTLERPHEFARALEGFLG